MEIFENKTSVTSVEWADTEEAIDECSEDNYGNKYDHSFSIKHGYVVYLTNYKYKEFSGTVAFPKGLECDSYRKSVTLRIYGDDKEILKFENVDNYFKATDFSLDISGYERSFPYGCLFGIFGNIRLS